jgi:hypothetical protein
MNRKRLFIILLILIFLASPYVFVKYKLNTLEEKVSDYLIHSKGYDSSDLISVEGKFGKLPNFSVDVIFKDEPMIIYRYIQSGMEIKQRNFTITDEAMKNNYDFDDINKSELKHLEEYRK